MHIDEVYALEAKMLRDPRREHRRQLAIKNQSHAATVAWPTLLAA